tara:strand:- start:337 stop:483 length:147 start_codon:yes stop_codon:yes gene_type:complete
MPKGKIKPNINPPRPAQPSTSGPKVVVSSTVTGIYKGKNNGSAGPKVI